MRTRRRPPRRRDRMQAKKANRIPSSVAPDSRQRWPIRRSGRTRVPWIRARPRVDDGWAGFGRREAPGNHSTARRMWLTMRRACPTEAPPLMPRAGFRRSEGRGRQRGPRTPTTGHPSPQVRGSSGRWCQARRSTPSGQIASYQLVIGNRLEQRAHASFFPCRHREPVMDEAFALQVTQNARGPVVRLAGELDLDAAPAFEASMRTVCGELVTIDFSEVTFMDSTALGVLVAATTAGRSTAARSSFTECSRTRCASSRSRASRIASSSIRERPGPANEVSSSPAPVCTRQHGIDWVRRGPP